MPAWPSCNKLLDANTQYGIFYISLVSPHILAVELIFVDISTHLSAIHDFYAEPEDTEILGHTPDSPDAAQIQRQASEQRYHKDTARPNAGRDVYPLAVPDNKFTSGRIT